MKARGYGDWDGGWNDSGPGQGGPGGSPTLPGKGGQWGWRDAKISLGMVFFSSPSHAKVTNWLTTRRYERYHPE